MSKNLRIWTPNANCSGTRLRRSFIGLPSRCATFRRDLASFALATVVARPPRSWHTWATCSIGRSRRRKVAAVWKQSEVQSFTKDATRFFAAAQALDDYLASDAPLGCSAEQLFQGPIADALTHVGQLATLRRLADAPVRGENYFVAEIAAGRVGPDQAAPVREFD